MKSRLPKLILVLIAITVAGSFIVAPHEAHASCSLTSFSATDCVDELTAWIFNVIIQGVMVLWLTLAGTLLNAALVITLNMNQVVNNVSIINTVWSIIRNLSSIIIIFFLLYSSIKIILGKKGDSDVRTIIINVVMAGLLINFSLFFTKVAIDASNIISLALYRAIAPGQVIDFSTSDGYINAAFNDGGLSNVFMNALKIQTHFDASGASNTNNNITFFKVLVQGIGGIALMAIAALSFTVAALIFAIRTGMLIILMAFSPIYFVGWIVPKLKEKLSKKWMDSLTNQLLNMPIYFAFMYVCMMVITNKQFQNFIDPSTATANGVGSAGSGLLSAGTTGAVIQYAIAIVLINIPLIAAMLYAGDVTKGFINDFKKNVKGMANKAVNGTVGFAGRNTFGWGASAAAGSERFRKFAANAPILGGIAEKGLKSISGSSFGGAKGGFDKARSENEKRLKDQYKSIGNVRRSDFATEDEFNRAERRALAMQKTYMENLKNMPLAKVMGTVQTGHDLKKDYDKAWNKEYKEDLEKARDRDADAISSLQFTKGTAVQTRANQIEKHKTEGSDNVNSLEFTKGTATKVRESKIKQLEDETSKVKQTNTDKLQQIALQKKLNEEQTEQTNRTFENTRKENEQKIAQLETEIKSTFIGFSANNPENVTKRTELQKKIDEIHENNLALEPQKAKWLDETAKKNAVLDQEKEKIVKENEALDETLKQQISEIKELGKKSDEQFDKKIADIKKETQTKINQVNELGKKSDEQFDGLIKEQTKAKEKRDVFRDKVIKKANDDIDMGKLKNMIKENQDKPEPPAPPAPKPPTP